MEFVYWKTGLIRSSDNPNPSEFEKRPTYYGLFKLQEGESEFMKIDKNCIISSDDKQEFIEESVKIFKEILDKSK
jgi:hypothetical protein